MKKTLAMVLALALLCVLAVNSTLSYFTDTAAAANTMTVGKVDIEQHQKDRNGTDVPKSIKMYPYTGTTNKDGTVYGGFRMYDTAKNAIDKIVTVTLQDGSEDAYVRTIFAFEAFGGENPIGNMIHLNYNEDQTVGVWGQCMDGTEAVTYTKNGTVYYLYMFTYKAALTSENKTSAPSLLQFYLDSKAENEFSGGGYEILVLSQAVQTKGFESAGAVAALNTAFGVANGANAEEWFK